MGKTHIQPFPEDAVRLRSYLIWEREGSPDGRELDYWLRAEKELEAEYRAAPPGDKRPLKKRGK